MRKKNRPLSPHLTVYKPQITSIISIFHRISGASLAMSLVVFVLIFYFESNLSEFYLYYNQTLLFQMYLYWFFLTLSCFLPMVGAFHFLNGIRHLVWDLAIGLDSKNLAITGFFVLIASLLILLVILF